MSKTVTLENAKALVEAGIVLETDRYWELNKVNELFNGRVVFGNPEDDNAWAIGIPAPDTNELLEALPDSIPVKDRVYQLNIIKNGSQYYVGFVFLDFEECCRVVLHGSISAETPQDALALLIIETKGTE